MLLYLSLAGPTMISRQCLRNVTNFLHLEHVANALMKIKGGCIKYFCHFANLYSVLNQYVEFHAFSCVFYTMRGI